MIRKVVLILTLMLVVLLAVTNVSAADNLTDEIVDETVSSSISAVDNLDNELIDSEDTSEINTDNLDKKTTSLVNDDSADSSENYQYAVSLNNYTVDGGYNSESITMHIHPTNSNGSDYNYDFYLNIYDSNNVKKVSKRYRGTGSASSSFSTVTYQLGTSDFHPEQGVFTMKIVNTDDNFEMTSAKLTIKTIPYSAYSVNVPDTDMMYWTSGTIPINVHVLSGDYYSYRFQYDFYLNIYDSNNNVRFSKNYYGKSSAASTTINHDFFADTIGYGLFTVKIINTMDNHLMATAKLNIVKISIESEDLSVTCEDIIQYKVRVSKNDQYESGLTVLFICNNIEYTRVTDSNGYATLNVYLDVGDYSITTKCNTISKKNNIHIKTTYADNIYKNLYLESLTTVYGVNKNINYGWQGFFKGVLNIYKDSTLIKSIAVDNSKYINTHVTYDKYSSSISSSVLNEIGKYILKIMDINGSVIVQSTITINKAPTHVESYYYEVFKNYKDSVAIYLEEKNTKKPMDGTVTVKINGKSYNVNIMNGVGELKFTSPSKFGKYKCTIYYGGDNMHEASSNTFTLNVIKYDSDIFVSAPSKVKPGSKIKIKAKVYYKYGTKKVKSGIVKFKINGKTYKSKIKNGIAKLTIKAKSKAKIYSCKASYSGNKNIQSTSTKFKINAHKKTKSKSFTVIVPAKLNKKISRSHGKYKVTTYKWIDYYSNGKKEAHLRITVYKNGKRLTNFKAEYYVHYISGGGKWLYTNNHGEKGYKITYVGYNNVLKAYKVTTTVWVKS